MVEGWLSAAASSRSRGGVLSFYLVTTKVAIVGGQLVLAQVGYHVAGLVRRGQRRVHAGADPGGADPYAAATGTAARPPGTPRTLPTGSGGGRWLRGVGSAQRCRARADADLRYAAGPAGAIHCLAAERRPVRQLRLPVADRPPLGSGRPALGDRRLCRGSVATVAGDRLGRCRSALAAAALLPLRRQQPFVLRGVDRPRR